MCLSMTRSMTTHRSSAARLTLAVVAVLVAAALSPSPAQVQDAPEAGQQRALFEGTWRLATPRSQANGILDRAADAAANAMNFFVRGIARSRLREGSRLYEEVGLHFGDDGRLTVRFDEQSYTTRIGRTERRQNREGEERRVTQRFRANGQLEQVFETDSGTRWYVWTSTGEGRLRLEVTTNSPQMPQPMVYVLDYRRAE
jgi:hypothetical protein